MDSHGDGGKKGPRARRWGRRGKGGGGGSFGGVVSPGAGAGRLQPGREPPLLRVRPARGHLRGYHRGQLRLYHLLGPPVSGQARGADGEGVVESRDRGDLGRRDRAEVRDGAEAWRRAGCGERVVLCSGVMEKGKGQASQDTQLESRCRGKEGHPRGKEKLPKGGEENRK